MTLAVDGDGPLLHRLEQRGLRFRRGAIDFIRQDEIGEYRTRSKRELLSAREQRDAGDVGGHQVRGELDAHEPHVERERERAHEQRLGRAGNALEQDVPAREQADEHFERRRVLPQHHFA